MRSPKNNEETATEGRNGFGVVLLQFSSIVLMWIFLSLVTFWILRLVYVSVSLGDAPDGSVAISLVAIPVYTAIAGVLTYTFFGLRGGARETKGGDS